MRLVKGNPVLAGAGLVAGIALVALACVSVNLNFGLPANLNLGWPPGFDYRLSAAFEDANGLAKGADVAVAGTRIGQVTDIRAVGRQAVATMRIDRRYAPLHRGTIARIRYSTLLAQKFVELTPAAGGPAMPSGSRIPSASTITPVDFDQFLSTLDPQTRQQLQVLVQQLGGGVQGREAAINALLDNWGHLAVESRAGLATLHQHDADIASITSNLAITSRRLAQSRDNLGGFVQNAADVNGAIASQDRDLAGLIYHLANTMNDFDTTLNGEEGNLHSTVTEFDPFLLQLNGTLSYLYPYVHDSLGPVRQGLDVLIPEIESAVHDRDANGNYLRQYLVADSCWDSIQSAPGCGGTPLAQQAARQPAPAAQAGTGSPVAGPPAPAPGPTICPTLSPPVNLPPLPLPTIGPCPPTPLPCLPGPGRPAPATPTPTPTPSPGCSLLPPVGLPGNPVLPLPVPSLPGVITNLVNGGL